MLFSPTLNPQTPTKPFSSQNPLFSTSFITPLPSLTTIKTTPPHIPKPTKLSIHSTLIPSSPPPASSQQLYQPFHPPPSPIPSQYRSLDANSRLQVLSNRLGLWYEYAPLISSLLQEGFTPPSLEEVTGISGVEQNRLVVAAKVRASLVQSKCDPELVAAFDRGGAELLYEIRLLSASQRAAAARFIIENRMDAKGAENVARAIKDYPRRRGDNGWESFDYTLPGDCFSFMYYRQAREHRNPSPERTSALETALEVAESEKAKNEVLKEIQGEGESKVEEEVETAVRVPVVRLMMGEVAEASSVVVLPVCRAEEREREVLDAPWEYRSEGHFGVVVADKGWNRWVVLPGWEPAKGLERGGMAIAFSDARALPWKANRWYKEEAILVVADRGNKQVRADDGFYLIDHKGGGDGRSGGLKVERGSALKERGMEESLGTVVLVVRPPREENDEPSDEDWE